MQNSERESMKISWSRGVRLEAAVRGHRLVVDQPKEEGGEDNGITPVEMFAASLGACIGYYAVRFCQRHQLPEAGLSVNLSWDYAEQPHRIGTIDVQVALPKGFPEPLKDRIQKVIEGCTVHNSLTHPPRIAVVLQGAEG